MESAAAVDVVALRRLGDPTQVATLRALFVRVIQRLTKMDDALA